MFSAKAMRPVIGALAALPVVPLLDQRKAWSVSCQTKEFRPATCIKNEKHTHDTRKITFELQGTPWTTQGAISNVAVRVGAGVRPYNPLSAESGTQVTLLVKRYADAKVGGALHELEPGSKAEIKGPNQQWQFEEGKYAQYTLLAGGTGITPLFQNAGYILSNDAKAKVTMVTFNKTGEDVLLRSELKALQEQYPGRLKVIHVIESAEGRPTEAMLKKLVPSAKGSQSVLVMVCGRPDMTKAIAGPKAKDYTQGEVGGFLKALGFSKEQVWKV
eukprot:TRINITY_DN21620_c0_g1_i1.p1 TRINITY_DN21620_c0_g1~~TRINITY_DN21620_c0_g1_i1.p1  ORF type:complete len:300 (-),score=66.30 TRINITY_DN21620_c0_g1_i1:181-999(-)